MADPFWLGVLAGLVPLPIACLITAFEVRRRIEFERRQAENARALGAWFADMVNRHGS